MLKNSKFQITNAPEDASAFSVIPNKFQLLKFQTPNKIVDNQDLRFVWNLTIGDWNLFGFWKS